MCKDIVENNQEPVKSDREETIEKKKESKKETKEWKDIINLPDDLDFEIH
ncbi:MAG: hypothetical protein PVJ87_07620 [Desulfobacterales bacterium]|jgi:hypothetical protein